MPINSLEGLVPDATVWEDMDGEDEFTQKVNSLLTCIFVSKKYVPSDECINEAEDLKELCFRGMPTENEILKYLIDRFASFPDPATGELEIWAGEANKADVAAPQVLQILKDQLL